MPLYTVVVVVVFFKKKQTFSFLSLIHDVTIWWMMMVHVNKVCALGASYCYSEPKQLCAQNH